MLKSSTKTTNFSLLDGRKLSPPTTSTLISCSITYWIFPFYFPPVALIKLALMMEIPRVRFEGRSDPAARCQRAERAAWRPDLQPGPGRGSPAKPGRGGGPGTRQRSSPQHPPPGGPAPQEQARAVT